MFCRSCGEEVPSYSAFCLHCGSKIAIQQAVPLTAKSSVKKRKYLPWIALGVAFYVALIVSLSSSTVPRQSVTLSLMPSPTATPFEPLTPVEALSPLLKRSAKAASKSRIAPTPVDKSESTTLYRSAPKSPTATQSAVSAAITAPQSKQAEATFYTTRTGARYHRAGCRHLRQSSYPTTQAAAEASGYTPCRVCYP